MKQVYRNNVITTTIDSSVAEYLSDGNWKPDNEFHPNMVNVPDEEDMKKIHPCPYARITELDVDVDKLAAVLAYGYNQPVSGIAGADGSVERVTCDLYKEMGISKDSEDSAE
jgi:hypothetical protein